MFELSVEKVSRHVMEINLNTESNMHPKLILAHISTIIH